MDNKPEVSFGQSRYSPVMKEFYTDSMRLLGLSSGQAEKAAKALGADLGRCQADNKISVGKVSGKDMRITVKEVATIKTNLTYSIGLCKACAMLQEIRKYGVKEAEIELNQAYQDWLNGTPQTPVLSGEKKESPLIA